MHVWVSGDDGFSRCTMSECVCASNCRSNLLQDPHHRQKRPPISWLTICSFSLACLARYGGASCDVPLLSSRLDPCLDGVVDLQGVCCRGFMDAISGACCASAIDINGVCCNHPRGVDACGVCGGSGVAVDITGTCCSSALPPSRLCCKAPAEVDSCGVCGGVNMCEAQVSIVVQLTGYPNSTASAETISVAVDTVAVAAGVPSDGLLGVRLMSLGNDTVSCRKWCWLRSCIESWR